MSALRVLFAAAEAAPWVKVGGLGDVAGALPRALQAFPNVEVRLVLPRHQALHDLPALPLLSFPLPLRQGALTVEVFEFQTPGLTVYLIDGEPIRASGPVYTADAQADAEKYAFFSMALLELALQDSWAPQILHLNDWHTALAAYGLQAKRASGKVDRLRSLLTVHNLPFMGPDVSALLSAYALPRFRTRLPTWAEVRPLPLGLWAADALATVSPTYAQEILTPEHGCGLEDFLLSRRAELHGILNGLDTEAYNPATDSSLVAPFSAERLEPRLENKRHLLQELGLAFDPQVPLVGMVSRVDRQKGIDLAMEALELSLAHDWQAVFLGVGNVELEAALREFERRFPQRVRTRLQFDAALARRLYAASDIFLMPSRYEPCGLAQMIAMRYGALPVAHATGGLKDTIEDAQSGFLFHELSAQACAQALERAFQAYARPAEWQRMQRYAMQRDFSWSRSAQEYLRLYEFLVKAVPVER